MIRSYFHVILTALFKLFCSKTHFLYSTTFRLHIFNFLESNLRLTGNLARPIANPTSQHFSMEFITTDLKPTVKQDLIEPHKLYLFKIFVFFCFWCTLIRLFLGFLCFQIPSNQRPKRPRKQLCPSMSSVPL